MTVFSIASSLPRVDAAVPDEGDDCGSQPQQVIAEEGLVF